MFSQIACVEAPYKSINQLPMIKGDQVVLLAILVQNAQQPKNKHRTDAIADKTYREIKSKSDAEKYILSILKVNLENELRGVEKEVMD
mgnify:CR=1 FL=1